MPIKTAELFSLIMRHEGLLSQDHREGYFVPDFPGVARCTWRLVLHFFDWIIFFLGFIRPLWHWWRQTYADSLAHTYVGRDADLYLERNQGAYDRHTRQLGGPNAGSPEPWQPTQ